MNGQSGEQAPETPLFKIRLGLCPLLRLLWHGHHGRPSKKKVTDEAEVAVADAALAWPTGWYDSFIPYLLVRVLAVYDLFVDVLVLCYRRVHIFRFQYELHTMNAMFTVWS